VGENDAAGQQARGIERQEQGDRADLVRLATRFMLRIPRHSAPRRLALQRATTASFEAAEHGKEPLGDLEFKIAQCLYHFLAVHCVARLSIDEAHGFV
jgi:hypothetical protein